MERYFEQELKSINRKLLLMAHLAQEMIRIVIESLSKGNGNALPDIDSQERQVNELHIEIDVLVLTLVARMQPVAKDLRFLFAASKIGNELERIADLAINIKQHVEFLKNYPQLKPYVIIPLMADAVRQALDKSITAYVARDTGLAEKVLIEDDKIDSYKNAVFNELLSYMMKDRESIPRAVVLILISRNLERIGDHATNIVEEVIFMVQGRDVRHHHESVK